MYGPGDGRRSWHESLSDNHSAVPARPPPEHSAKGRAGRSAGPKPPTSRTDGPLRLGPFSLAPRTAGERRKEPSPKHQRRMSEGRAKDHRRKVSQVSSLTRLQTPSLNRGGRRSCGTLIFGRNLGLGRSRALPRGWPLAGLRGGGSWAREPFEQTTNTKAIGYGKGKTQFRSHPGAG